MKQERNRCNYFSQQCINRSSRRMSGILNNLLENLKKFLNSSKIRLLISFWIYSWPRRKRSWIIKFRKL